jgi:calpain-15
MAEDPFQIFELFHTKEINAAGCYLVYLYVNGVRRSVILDDFLPCRYGKPIFAHSNVSDVWVCLIEKAWAKLHGSYEKIDKGSACVAASML